MINGPYNVFLFWNESFENIPLIHKMNINNIRNRLKNTHWNVILTSLDKGDEFYIEKIIDLPNYFFEMHKKHSSFESIPGNQSYIVRLRLLEKYGGVYFDVSTILLRNNIDDICLYKKFIEEDACIAGYTNFTFTRKNQYGDDFFQEGKDGIELGILYAKKNTKILKIINKEIDSYWNWKDKNKDYKDYPLFKKYNLTAVSFLNEYHVHYSIFHLVVTRNNSLLDSISVQSIHMKGKENSVTDGPYAITDRFCRGESSYDSADPRKLFNAFLDGVLRTNELHDTNLKDRIKLFSKMDLIVIPGYMRVFIEKESQLFNEFFLTNPCYDFFYNISR